MKRLCRCGCGTPIPKLDARGDRSRTTRKFASTECRRHYRRLSRPRRIITPEQLSQWGREGAAAKNIQFRAQQVERLVDRFSQLDRAAALLAAYRLGQSNARTRRYRAKEHAA
jgi:hypothetical protein